jgi:HTH-type transcriptional regulator / antitoxin HigA
MNLKIIKTEQEYEEMLHWADNQLDNEPIPNTYEGEQLQIALVLIKAYEDVNYPIPNPDPIEVIKLKMEERGMVNKDLIQWIGSKSYVSALLNKKKPLTLRLARVLHQQLGIPAQVFLG